MTVGSFAFSGCKALSSISLPEVMTVGNSAFYDCAALTTLTFNTPITAWGTYMFSGVSTLDITLTLAAGQKVMQGSEENGYTASTTDEFTNWGTGKKFCGDKFDAIKSAAAAR
jgi:hypothetical protein